MENNNPTSNIINEVLFVGCMYKNPELLIEYSQYVRSKYDFEDEAVRFFYDNAEIMYKHRTQTFNQTTISTYFAEDAEKLSLYKRYGEWKTINDWMKLANTEDIKNCFEVLKKYSLLREYKNNGYAVEKIINHPKFDEFSANDVYRLIRTKADRIKTVIMTNNEAEVLNSHITSTLLACMEKPDMGVVTPYPIFTDIFRGLKLKSTMAVGMLSNAGKSRFMTKLIAYVTLVLHERVLVLLNEMTVEEIRHSLITTVINNPEFQELHGIKLKKKEKELTLGLYRDSNGEFIYKNSDKNGSEETVEEYVARVAENSEEYQKVMQIAKWIEAETNELIYVKDMSGGYDDKSIEYEVRKYAVCEQIKYVFYDTFKQDISDVGDWSAMKATATKFTELMKENNMFGYLSIQLTDDTNFVKPDELTSSNIASCKNIKHVLHTMILFKEIPPQDYYKYGYEKYEPDWGSGIKCELDPNKRYYIANVDKNRFGRKAKLVFEVNLDTNEWFELGELIKRK